MQLSAQMLQSEFDESGKECRHLMSKRDNNNDDDRLDIIFSPKILSYIKRCNESSCTLYMGRVALQASNGILRDVRYRVYWG